MRWCLMYKKEVLERRAIDNNVVQSKYSVGNKVYIVNSCFDGKEQLENLLFNIFHNKSIAPDECRERA